jgi:chorismate dehydratase
VAYFESEDFDRALRVVYDLPSRLPALLDAGLADAVLASSFEALRDPTRKVASGCAICTEKEAASVRIFSKRPWQEVESLALDRSSLTSNELALVVLAERFGVHPRTHVAAPDLPSMLAHADAAVLIGDRGLDAVGDGLLEMDLGHEWFGMTGLPFVWALWIGGEGLDGPLVSELGRAKSWGCARIEQLAEHDARTSGRPLETARRYLSQIMSYDLGEREIAGLLEFQKRLAALGRLPQAYPLRWVRDPVGV